MAVCSPTEGFHVAFAQPRQAGELEGVLQDGRVARGVGEPYQFLLRQVFLFCRYGVMRSRKPLGFSRIFRSRYAVCSTARNVNQ